MTRTYAPEVLEYLSQFDPRLLQTTEGRRVLTRLEPQLFVLLYLQRHITDKKGVVSFSSVHEDWYAQMQTWVKPNTVLRGWRKAFVAPREMGKSTTWFAVAPIWAGAHGHSEYVMAFADTGRMAERHLRTFKRELQHNVLLRRDYPEFTGSVADNQTMYQSKSGFTFSAMGIDSTSLGAKEGNVRPDVMIFDDIEPDGSNYSAGQMEKRRDTVVNGVLALNEAARAVFVGTVTMAGSLMHQIVQAATTGEVAPWISDSRIVTHYYPPIVHAANGEELSVWPSKWSLEYLKSIEHTRDYTYNFLNNPLGASGAFWTMEDFVRAEIDTAEFPRILLTVDPATTSGPKSDYTGIAVIAGRAEKDKCAVLYAEETKLIGEALRLHLSKLIATFDVPVVYIETNQGGESLAELLTRDLPVKVKTVHVTGHKEVRAERALSRYQRRQVVHALGLAKAEQQMVAFPKGAHDDMVDAVGMGVRFLLEAQPEKRVASARSHSYV